MHYIQLTHGILYIVRYYLNMDALIHNDDTWHTAWQLVDRIDGWNKWKGYGILKTIYVCVTLFLH